MKAKSQKTKYEEEKQLHAKGETPTGHRAYVAPYDCEELGSEVPQSLRDSLPFQSVGLTLLQVKKKLHHWHAQLQLAMDIHCVDLQIQNQKETCSFKRFKGKITKLEHTTATFEDLVLDLEELDLPSLGLEKHAQDLYLGLITS